MYFLIHPTAYAVQVYTLLRPLLHSGPGSRLAWNDVP